MTADLVCPLCLHAAGVVELDALARVRCPACASELVVDGIVKPIDGFPTVPARQLARRCPPPRRTKLRVRRDGDELALRIRYGLLTPLVKRVILGPDGYGIRSWRGMGVVRPIAELRGFVLLQRHLGPLEGTLQLVWLSYVVTRGPETDRYAPIYMHRKADGEYCVSLLNEQLELLRHRIDPYRG
jgi:hypothetical protein